MPPGDAATFAARACRHSTAFVWLTALALAVAGPLLVPLIYGEPYAASVVPMLVLLPATALLTTYMLLSRFFMSIDRQQVGIATQAVSAVVNVGLNLVLIPRLGVLGAALASLFSYTLEAALITAAFRWTSGIGIASIFVLRREDWRALRARVEGWMQRRGP